MKSRFLAAASHDLRQPLQTLNLLQAVLARTVRDAGTRSVIENLGDTLAAMTDTLDTLLDLDRLESGTVAPEAVVFPVNSALSRLQSEFRLLAEAKGLDLRVVASSALVSTDLPLLDRLLENLVANAIKYTEAGKVLLGCRRRGAKLAIEVWDTGVGIPADKLTSIFDEYYQVDNPALERRRGLGLGLALVQRIAHLLGHPVDVRSTFGKGSMFAVTVPLATTAGDVQLRPLRAQSAPTVRTPALAVLLVEDDAPLRESLRMFLELEGYAVSATKSAAEALALIEEGRVRPAILIADRNLPGAMSGPALCRELEEVLPQAVPAIVLTGDSSPEATHEIAESGAEHLRKPVDPEKLAALIQRLLKTQPGGAVPPAPIPTADLAEMEPARSEVNIHVVDDEPSVRKAVQTLLQRLGYGVETFPTAEAFLSAYQPRGLECLMVDVSMPGMSGLQLQEILNDRRIAIPVIVITGRQDVPVAVQAMRAGAVDFLEKPVSGERLLEALERALASGTRKAEAAKARAEIEGRLAHLTAREREVLDLVVEGLANKKVAARLGISPRTAETHRARIMEKTGARSLAELVRISLGAGTARPN